MYDLRQYQILRRQGHGPEISYQWSQQRFPTHINKPRNRELGRNLGRLLSHTSDSPQTSEILEIFNNRTFPRFPISDIVSMFSLEIRQCDDCGRWFDTADIDDNEHCSECAENYGTCEHARCHGLVRLDDCLCVEDETVCADCFRESYVWNSDGERHWEEEEEEEEEEEDHGISSHGESINQCHKIGATHGSLVDCGIELEFLTCRHGSVADIAKELRDCCDIVAGVEDDGSLCNEASRESRQSAEIVTHYGDMATVCSRMEAVSRILRKNSCISHDTDSCGLHVSLSSDQVSTYTLAKYLVFWHSAGNRPLLELVCRRWNGGQGSYAKFLPEKSTNIAAMTSLDQYALQNSDRYECVNLLSQGRIEVRAFRGTCKLSTIRACIQLAVLSLAFCQAEEMADLSTKHFLRWLTASELGQQHGTDLVALLRNRKVTLESDC